MDLHENCECVMIGVDSTYIVGLCGPCECVMIGVDSTYIVGLCGPILFAMPNTTKETHPE